MAGRKFFTMSFDDGLEQDKKIIEIQKSFGLNCTTFNLNSGLFGEKSAIGRMGNLGFQMKPLVNGALPEDGNIIHYHNHFQIPADEALEIYHDVEVACHGVNHLNARKLKKPELYMEIYGDKAALEEKFGRTVTGFVYPYGASCKSAANIVKECGFLFTRGIKSTHSYAIPNDFLTLQPTTSVLSKKILEMLDEFIETRSQQDLMFYVWGHGYELDYNTETGSFEHLKRVLDKVAGRDDIICCTNGEIVASVHKGGKD